MNCVDCGEPVVVFGRYCHHCGARIVQSRLTIRDLLSDLFTRVTNLERGLWPTVRDMIVKPGGVCLGYINGMRKRYTPPATYALIVGSVYALLSILDSEIYWYEEMMGGMVISAGETNLEGEVLSVTDPDLIDNFKPFRLPLLFMPVIIITLINKLFYRKQLNWAEQAVVSLYYYSQLLLIFLFMHLTMVLFNFSTQGSDSEGLPLLEMIFLFFWLGVFLGFKIYSYNKVYTHRNLFKRIVKPVFAFMLGCLLNVMPYLALVLFFQADKLS